MGKKLLNQVRKFLRPSKVYIWLAWLVIAIGIIIRFLNLEADPPFWMEHWITDEAFYVHNARNKFIFDTWVLDKINHGLFFCPLWTSSLLGIFKIFGISFFSIRVLSSFFGGITLVVFYYLIKPYLNEKQTLLVIFFISFSSLLIHFSRVGLGETFTLFFLLLSFFFWMRSLDWPKRRNLFCLTSGLVFGFSLLFKIAGAINFLIFIFLWLFQWKRKEIGHKDLCLFFIGFLCTMPSWGILYLLSKGQWWAWLSIISEENILKPGISILTNPLNIQYFLTNHLMGSHPILWILFIGYLVWLIDRIIVKKESLADLNSLEILALAIILGGTLSTIFLAYQPEQRILPFIWAMGILATLLITHPGLAQVDLEALHQNLRGKSIWQRYLWSLSVVFFFWFFIIFALSGVTEKMSWSFGKRPGIGFLGLTVATFPLWIAGVLWAINQKRVWKAFFLGTVGSLTLLGITRLFLNLQLFFGIEPIRIIPINLRLREIGLTLMPILLFSFLISFKAGKRITVWKHSWISVIVVISIFGGFHSWQGILPIVKPTYTVKSLAEYLAREKDIQRIYATGYQTTQLLSRASLSFIFKQPATSLNLKHSDRSIDSNSYAINIIDCVPKESKPNMGFLDPWEENFPIPPCFKLEGIHKICPFGINDTYKYTFAIWRHYDVCHHNQQW